MKKIIALAFVLSLLLVPAAFALQCEASQAHGGSDACWTTVQLTPSVIGAQVSAGTVLVFDYQSGRTTYADGTLKQAGSWYVKPATVSLDSSRVAGILQKSIDSTKLGDPVQVLVRGYGIVKTTGNIASGDALYVAVAADSTTGTLGYIDFSKPGMVSGSTNIATALETSTNNATHYAYIRVV